MLRQELLQTIETYGTFWPLAPYAGRRETEETQIIERFRRFIADTPACFERSHEFGHVTGSALVTSPTLDRVLLTLHRKLGKWLQLGGHADGDHRLHAVAAREVDEESGLGTLPFLSYEGRLADVSPRLPWPLPFDLDCHMIPARKTEAAHAHFDVRYLMVADPEKPLVISNESKDLRWFTMTEAAQVTSEPSMLRQFAKLVWLRQVVDSRG